MTLTYLSAPLCLVGTKWTFPVPVDETENDLLLEF